MMPQLESFELLQFSTYYGNNATIKDLAAQLARMPALLLLDLSGSAVGDLQLPASLAGLTKLVAEGMGQVGLQGAVGWSWCMGPHIVRLDAA